MLGLARHARPLAMVRWGGEGTRRFVASAVAVGDSWKQLSELWRAGRLREMDATFAACADVAGKGAYKLMLQKAMQEGDGPGAKLVFDRLVTRGETPDEALFQLLVSTLADAGMAAEAAAYLGAEEGGVAVTFLGLCPKSDALGASFARVLSRRGTGETAVAHRDRAERLVAFMRRNRLRIPGTVFAELIRVRARAPEDGVTVLSAVRDTISLAEKFGRPIDAAMLEACLAAFAECGVARDIAWWFYEHFANSLKAAEMTKRPAQFLLTAVLRAAPTFAAAEGAMRELNKLGVRLEAGHYHLLLVSLCRDRSVPERVALGQGLVEEMKAAGLQPSPEATAALAALSCAEKQLSWREALESHGAAEESHVGALMERLQKMGRHRVVLQMWEEAVESGRVARPDARVFLAAIRASLVRLPRGNLVLDPRYAAVLERLHASDYVEPTEELLVAMLRAEGLGGHEERAMKSFHAILRGQMGDFKASRAVMRAMIETLSHTADGARIVPRLLDLAQREFNLAIDITFYNLWLSALRFAEEPPTPEAIRELYDQIAARGLMPDKVTFNSLIALLDLVPLEQDVTRHVHFFLHEWWRVSRHAGKDSVTNNLLLRVLGSRHTEHSNVVCIRIYKFMKSSEDPQQWPDSYTFHTLVKELVRKGKFNQAVGMVKDAYEHIEEKRKRGLQQQGFWRHTIEYLMGTLLGSQHTRLAERLRKIAADHGFVMGCPVRDIEDD